MSSEPKEKPIIDAGKQDEKLTPDSQPQTTEEQALMRERERLHLEEIMAMLENELCH